MQMRTLITIDGPHPRVHILALILAFLIGASILLCPPYVPLLFIALLLGGYALIERPETALYPIAFTAMFIHVFLGYGRHPGVEIIYDRYNLLIVDVFSAAAVMAIIVGRSLGTVAPLRRHNFDIPILLLALYATTSLLWTKDFAPGVTILLQFLSAIVLFYTPIILLRRERTLHVFLWIWLIVGIAAAVMAIITLYVRYHSITLLWWKYPFETYIVDFKYTVFDNIKQRVAGFSDPNRVAFLLNTAFLAGLALLLTARKRFVKIMLSIIMFFLLYTIMHTLSKGGIGALVVTITLFVLIHQRFKGSVLRSLTIFIAAIVLAIALMSFIDLKGGLGRFGQSPVENRGSTSLALRFKWWRGDMKALTETSGLGTGVGGMSRNIWAYAQSSYFSLLAELGFIGFLLAVWFVITVAIDLYAAMNRIRGDNIYFTVGLMAAGCVVIFFIHSLVDFGYNLRIPWLMAGLAIAVAERGAIVMGVNEGG
jgi:O-Antigen ligase